MGSVTRLVLLLLCAAVAAAREPKHLVWVAGLGLAAALASWAGRSRAWTIGVHALEGAVAGAAVVATGSADSPYLPYLLAPAFGGGLAVGLPGAVPPAGAAALALLLAPLAVQGAPGPTDLSAVLAEWVVLAVLVGGLGIWIRSVLSAATQAGDEVARAQSEAYRLLTELRSVARRLPGALDPQTTGETILARARELCRFDTGAVLVTGTGAEQLVAVARSGPERPLWDLSLSGDSPLAEAWISQASQLHPGGLPRTDGSRPTGSSAVVPLLSGSRSFGLLVLESSTPDGIDAEAVSRLAKPVAAMALQLQTGLAFDEVREIATHEERRRLAREIHDGVAQELASLGYALDNLAHDVADAASHEAVREQVDAIRGEVRRLVTELRMSLFDLRANVDPDEGLGAAIGRHVRAVGTASGMTVHLSLSESSLRLPAETEAELLRIVQEAVANARKHAAAPNLWVSCRVDPPAAWICIEDDGRGISAPAAAGSHGLAIMRERAERIRARVDVRQRVPRGTRVEVRVGNLQT